MVGRRDSSRVRPAAAPARCRRRRPKRTGCRRGPAAMPANGPCGPENGGIPLSGLGSTPGGGPTGRPEAIVWRSLLFEVERDALPWRRRRRCRADRRRTRMPCGRCKPSTTVSSRDPDSRTTRPAPDSATKRPAVGVERDADRIVQAGRQCLDVARSQRSARDRCRVRRTRSCRPVRSPHRRAGRSRLRGNRFRSRAGRYRATWPPDVVTTNSPGPAGGQSAQEARDSPARTASRPSPANRRRART